MKNLSRLLLVSSIFVLSLLLSSDVFAATTKSDVAKVKPAEVIVLAEVNIQDAKIDKQDNNNFDISFSLTNGKGLQTGVKYGVKLVSGSGKTQTTVEEKIYDESLTLHENSSIKKTIQYTASNTLDGVYSLFLTSKNETGFPFSTASLGEIRIKPVVKGLYVDSQSCIYYVNNSKDNSVYKTDQIVDIDNTESLGIKCVTLNNSDKEMQVTPSFVTNEKSVYGKIVKTDPGDTKTETFKAGEKKVISFVLPKASLPGLYFLTMGLKQGNENVSNTVSLTYLIRGNIASISNLFLDKDYYKKGDVANTSFMWNSVEGKLLRGNATSTPLTLTAIIKDYNNRKCSKPVTENLVRDFSKPKTDLLINITKDCFNPTVVLTIKDSSNTIIDEKSFTMQTTSVKKPINTIPFIIIILLILTAAIFYMYKKNKANPELNSSVPVNILIMFTILFGSLLFTNNVQAGSYYEQMTVGGASCYIAYSADINKPAGYTVNDTLTASATIGACGCSDGRSIMCGVESTVYQGGTQLAPTSSQLLSMYAGGGTSGSASYQLPSWGGSGQVNFKTSINGIYGGTSIGFTVSTPVAPTLSVWADNNAINAGTQAHIHWASSNATSCISTDGGTYDTRLNGDYYHTPTADKTYSVTCFGAGGDSIVKSTTVYVVNPTPTVTVRKQSTDSIPYNTSDTITWSSTDATSCSCFYYNTQNSGYCPGFTSSTGPTSGSFQTPNLISNTTYNFSCSN